MSTPVDDAYLDPVHNSIDAVRRAEHIEAIRVAVQDVVQELHRLRDGGHTTGILVFRQLDQQRDETCANDHVDASGMGDDVRHEGQKSLHERLGDGGLGIGDVVDSLAEEAHQDAMVDGSVEGSEDLLHTGSVPGEGVQCSNRGGLD